VRASERVVLLEYGDSNSGALRLPLRGVENFADHLAWAGSCRLWRAFAGRRRLSAVCCGDPDPTVVPV